MQTLRPKTLSVASLGCLLAAVALAVPVGERVVAAIWQGYKFASYGGGGHITLSISTGLLFSSALAVVSVVTLAVHHIAARKPSERTATVLSRWALGVIVVSAATYWLLGVSNLNVWRA
jgi:hypothetical protein